jgi:hypothetical protein
MLLLLLLLCAGLATFCISHFFYYGSGPRPSRPNANPLGFFRTEQIAKAEKEKYGD